MYITQCNGEDREREGRGRTKGEDIHMIQQKTSNAKVQMPALRRTADLTGLAGLKHA